MLVILDGRGSARRSGRQCRPPSRDADFDRLWRDGPHGCCALRRRCRPAGWPDGQFRGRPSQYRGRPRGHAGLPRIAEAIADGDDRARAGAGGSDRKAQGERRHLHLIGLVSPGGVHSHQDHAVALAKFLPKPATRPWCTRSLTAAIRRRTRRRRIKRSWPRCRNAHRHGLRPLLRDGSRQALGPRRASIARMVAADGPASGRAGRHRRRLCRRKDRRVHRPAVVGDYRGMKDGDGVLFFNFRADGCARSRRHLDPDFKAFPAARACRSPPPSA